MNYREALDFLAQFADFELTSSSRVRYRDFNLHRVNALLRRLGDPHLALPTVHVAGTKGKGSTAAMVASVLRAAGVRTGLYTSPHLHSMRERIAVDGVPVSEAELAQLIASLAGPAAEVNAENEHGRLTTFEPLTAAAFLHFREAGAGCAVVEVGLGGRLDATNVVSPEVCAITNISLDHTDVLGDSIAEIASEKAAIIKPGVPVVSGPQPPEALEVIESAAARLGAPLTAVGRDVTFAEVEADLNGQRLDVVTPRRRYRLWTPLLGDVQVENAATAVAVCERLEEAGLPVTEQAIRDGMASVEWPGRLEVLRREPLVLVDGAHNPYSVRRLMETVQSHFGFRSLIVVFGVTRSKDLRSMARELGQSPARVIATQSRHPKALSPELLGAAVRERGLEVEEEAGVAAAVERALDIAAPRDLVLVTGSLFTVAEARERLAGATPEPYNWSTPAAV